MKIIKKLLPGQSGTKKLVKKYGDALICVRYRDDPVRKKRIKTVEIAIEEISQKEKKLWIPPNKIINYPAASRRGMIRNIIYIPSKLWGIKPKRD